MSFTETAAPRQGIKYDVLILGALATLSLVLGLGINQFRDKPLPLIYSSKSERIELAATSLTSAPKAETPTTSVIILAGPLSLERFKEFVDKKQGLVLDARPEIFHRLGHVPGALSLPRDDFEARYTALRDKLEVSKSRPLAIYCSSASCEDAELLRQGLAKLGYTNPAIFTGGWAEWTGASLPEEKE